MQYLVAISTQKAEEAFELFYWHFYQLHSLSNNLNLDQEPEFLSEFWKLLYWRLNINAWQSTLYHPGTDNQTECINLVTENNLWAFVYYILFDLLKWLLGSEFAENYASSSTILDFLFLSNYGQ